jgi:hypothetical protein
MITRANYEEFFLLYTDNELSASDRQRVERFVAENPDLKEEWDSLLQCRLKPDQHLTFKNRDSLLKEEGFAEPAPELAGSPWIGWPESVSIWNGEEEKADWEENLRTPLRDEYEERFLSYIDGQLGGDDRRSVEDLVRLHPSLLGELERYRQTISSPDPAIVFTQKDLLYKKEPDKKYFWIPWGKIAAAAVITGLTGLLIFQAFQKGRQRAVALSVISIRKSTLTPPVVKEDIYAGKRDPTGAQVGHEEKGQSGQEARTSKTAQAGRKALVRQDALIQGALGQTLKKEPPAVTRRPSRPFYSSEERVIRPSIASQTNPANALIASRLSPEKAGPEKIEGPENPGKEVKKDFATQALLNNSIATSEELPAEESFTDAAASPRKNKFRGFFRKVSRVFDKTATRDDDDNHKLLIGTFQFALK